jgi:type I restriction enzyme R subunit
LITFSEDSRVKIPELVHFTRIGYPYLPLKRGTWDEKTDIFTEVLPASLARINPEAAGDDIA